MVTGNVEPGRRPISHGWRFAMTITVGEQGSIRLPEELLDRLGARPGSQLIAEEDERGILLRASGEKPLWQILSEAAESLPPDVLKNLPADGAEQHDHYIYGTPKRGRP